MSGGTTLNELKIFPNPAPNEFKISLKNPTDKTLNVQLLNMLGQVVYQNELQTHGNDEMINIRITHLPRGVYLLKRKILAKTL